jgi:leucyl-tRNA synthetase
LTTAEAKQKIVADLAKQNSAQEKVNYRMRDWSVSRQRYWGAPIPIIYCQKCGPQLVADKELPVILPELDDFKPAGDGRSALARAKDWLTTDCPNCGGPGERETDTLDTYICSSWYMYRYFDPRNQEQIFNSDIVKKWEPIDFYNGADHATAHLLYARFIGHFFKKLGLVKEAEPFKQFLFNGKVTASDGTMFSKSKGNGVDPLEIIEQGYGADALRTYLMFAAPLELWAKWDPQGVPGTYRFLSRLWNLTQDYLEAPAGDASDGQAKALLRTTHQTIKKMTDDIESNSYNTAIAAAMTMVNDLYKQKAEALNQNDAWKQALVAITALVAPFAPHMAEELWHQLGHSTTVHRDSWPKFDEKYLVQDTVTVAVQINGKVRAELQLAPDSDESAAVEAAKSNERVKAYIDGKEVVKTIYVPGKIVNIVVK